jgi:hypothetical protein
MSIQSTALLPPLLTIGSSHFDENVVGNVDLEASTSRPILSRDSLGMKKVYGHLLRESRLAASNSSSLGWYLIFIVVL